MEKAQQTLYGQIYPGTQGKKNIVLKRPIDFHQ